MLVTLAAVGYGSAALIIPPVTRRLTKSTWITIALLFAAGAVVTVAAFGETGFAQTGFLAIGFLLCT